MANAVVQKMAVNGGVYLPPELKLKKCTHFAADNFDFCEDTLDGRRTLHATVLVAYQSSEEGNVAPDLITNERECTSDIPDTIYTLLPCSITKNIKPVYRKLCHTELIRKQLLADARVADLSWLLGNRYCLTKVKKGINPHEYGLSWAAHKAFVIPCN